MLLLGWYILRGRLGGVSPPVRQSFPKDEPSGCYCKDWGN